MRSMAGAVRDRSSGIDTLRGLLVVGVILGHFFEITRAGSFAAWVGTGVRMPLFIGLSGYLFNLDRARAAPVVALLRRYYPRLILPWIVACVVHVTVTRDLTFGTPLSVILWPPFHLWFVPVMMAFILAATATRWSPDAMLLAAVPISIGAMYLLGVGHLPSGLYDWLPDRRFFIYPVYFFFGLWIARHRSCPSRQRVTVIVAAIGFRWWCSLYDSPGVAAEVAAELIACLPMIALLPVVAGWPIPLPMIAPIGRTSLFYYLWHPMVFALWRVCRADGVVLLALSLTTLVVLQRLIAGHASLAGILGLATRRSGTTARSLPLNPSATGVAS